MNAKQHYGGLMTIPRAVRKGRVLAHNHVRHTINMPNGLNGFRWWSWAKKDVPKNFIPCECGYAGLPHVAWEEHVKLPYKCEPDTLFAEVEQEQSIDSQRA
jgi:hypothetical protein